MTKLREEIKRLSETQWKIWCLFSAFIVGCCFMIILLVLLGVTR